MNELQIALIAFQTLPIQISRCAHRIKTTSSSVWPPLSFSACSVKWERVARSLRGNRTPYIQTQPFPWSTRTGRADSPTATGDWSTALRSGPTTAGNGMMWNAGPLDVPSVRLYDFFVVSWINYWIGSFMNWLLNNWSFNRLFSLFDSWIGSYGGLFHKSILESVHFMNPSSKNNTQSCECCINVVE